MGEQIAYRLLSGRQRESNRAPVTYLPADDPMQARRTRDVLDQYPYLRARVQVWVDRYDESALDDADAFVTAHVDDLDAEKAGHDLAVWLCNWVVVNDAGTRWFLDPRAGICFVELDNNSAAQLDPYRHVVECLTRRQPVARRFVEKARELNAV